MTFFMVPIARSPTKCLWGLLWAIWVLISYSRTACTSPLIFALPPEGSANNSPQTLQEILLTVLLKMSCSLPHFGHLTLRKTLLGFGISLFHSDIIFCSVNFIEWLVFVVGCRLYGAWNCKLCILSARFVFLLFWRIFFEVDIFVRRNLPFLLHGGVRLLLRLCAFQACKGLQRESDELYILDSKSLLL